MKDSELTHKQLNFLKTIAILMLFYWFSNDFDKNWMNAVNKLLKWSHWYESSLAWLLRKKILSFFNKNIVNCAIFTENTWATILLSNVGTDDTASSRYAICFDLLTFNFFIRRRRHRCSVLIMCKHW